jgi:hypothetical protein
MGQVTTHAQVETKDFITWFQAGEKNGRVGLCAAMGLHIGPGGVEDFPESFDGQAFDFVNYFATAIVPFTGIAFRILIGGHGTHGFHDLQGSEILGSDEFNAIALPGEFFPDKVEDRGIPLHAENLRKNNPVAGNVKMKCWVPGNGG